jgi:hypothetical protein
MNLCCVVLGSNIDTSHHHLSFSANVTNCAALEHSVMIISFHCTHVCTLCCQVLGLKLDAKHYAFVLDYFRK